MRKLFLLRGLPGCGKSTWVKMMNLESYTLSSDKLREMYAGLKYDVEGNLGISQKRDKIVWSTLYEMLEARMERGLTTIIDSTNISEKTLNKYQKVAEKYNYKTYIIDFTFFPVKTCIERNKNRGYQQVPEDVIYRMADKLKVAKIPKGIQVASLDEFNHILHGFDEERSAVKYDRITFIGDVHGCIKTLSEIFKSGIDARTLYVFTGDYIDRGPRSVETVLLLSQFAKRDNFIFLEGNHERWLRYWLENKWEMIRSKEFLDVTMPQFKEYFYGRKTGMSEDKKAELEQLRAFVNSLKEFALLKVNQDGECKYIFACHGGVPYVDIAVGLMSAEETIRGVGKYQDCDTVDNEFDKRLGFQLYQVHGHRNFYNAPIRVNGSVFNLEGSVERGGALRTVTFNLSNGTVTEIKTKEFKNIEEEK